MPLAVAAPLGEGGMNGPAPQFLIVKVAPADTVALKIIRANLQRKKMAHTDLLIEADKGGVQVVLVQEPYVGRECRVASRSGIRVFQSVDNGEGTLKAAIIVLNVELHVIQYQTRTTNNIWRDPGGSRSLRISRKLLPLTSSEAGNVVAKTIGLSAHKWDQLSIAGGILLPTDPGPGSRTRDRGLVRTAYPGVLVSSSVTPFDVSSDDVHPDELNVKGSTNRSKRQATFTGVILQGGKCVLPPHPDNGAYTVGGNGSAVPGEVYLFVYLTITCNPGFISEKNSLYCFEGFWSDPMPQCVRFCRLKKHASIQYQCLTPGVGLGSRVCGPIEPQGTIVKPVCRAPDYYYPGSLDYMTCNGYKWNYVAVCTLECGKVTPTDLLLVIGGDTAYKGELPWHVGIYRKTKPYTQICGGSLVSPTTVISAAHCFWSDKNKLLPPSLYAVAAGKIHRQWNDNRDPDAQKSDVVDIKVPPHFQGAGTNYQDDIAIVVIATPFTYRASVRPVCVDFDEGFSNEQLNGSTLGKVGGWGLVAKNGRPSQELKVVELPYVSVDECFLLTPPSFKEYITSDKMCAGYTNGTALCQGDSGGGLAFPAKRNSVERYYLRGVVSTAPKNADLCSANSLTAFTTVIKHENFIRKANEWKCRDGTCISMGRKCDSIIDCHDGSDETDPECNNDESKLQEGDCVLPPYPRNGSYIVVGNSNALPGQSYASVALNITCDTNYIIENETGSLFCHNGYWSSKMPKSKLQEGDCVLPPYPRNGSYIVVGNSNALPGQSYASVALNITCDTNYIIENETGSLFCHNGYWSSKMPKCVRFCSLKEDESVEYKCLVTGLESGSTTCGPRVAAGTVVIPNCRRPNYFSASPLKYMHCDDGIWDYIAKCTPECGTATPQGMALVTDGRNAERGELPWHAGIYTKTSNPYQLICGGSLITTNIVISAAHCFWKGSGLSPSSDYAVAVGKIYRSWNDHRDTDAQKSDVTEIKISEHFQGATTNYQSDISLVIIATPFTYKPFVRPVCIDFDINFNKNQLTENNLGKISGWGITEKNGNFSEVLKVVEIPYVSTASCIVKTPPSFREYITYDKFCAGYENGTALCRGDSGGGLAFLSVKGDRSRYFLRGVLSTGPRVDENLCSVNVLAFYTDIIKHENLIKTSLS
ncbi:unnamed protein product [Euphydryas editha]|uniref:Uncharacterized protein n=1 Tax=Euphydryas editha TaxID=104508 RepID=A0AAU9UU15_EUPED|nr:unnamed protein product [Euphydryas editha]